jgi:decaprenylphospho-beta-D-erythro-pentofuranosid-2-ulose 2-reductase
MEKGARMKTVLVIGATSSLAQAICRTLAKSGYGLILAGRDAGELALLAGDLTTRFGVHSAVLTADFLDADFSPERMIEQADDFDHVIIASGDMGNGASTDLHNIAYTIHLNYTVPAQIATAAALHFSPSPSMGEGRGGDENSVRNTPLPNPPPQGGRGNNSIVIISSVAGDRGRQSNYPYGSAKAALTAFASGLRNRYYKKGVHVMTVKPGFIDTPMTWGMKSPLIASREYVAEHIVTAMQEKKNVLYVPYFWWVIMLVIRHLPECIFKRLSL